MWTLRWKLRRGAGVVCFIGLWISSAGGAQPGAGEVFLLVKVRLNGQAFDDTYRVLRLNDGQFLVRPEDFNSWRLRAPSGYEMRSGEGFLRLSAVPGLSHRLDEANQELVLQAAAELFEGTLVAALPQRVAMPSPPPWGGFLNYDLSARSTGAMHALNGLAELGLFSPWGAATSTHLAQSLDNASHGVRLDTTLARDFPERRASLRLGDALTRPALGGGSVRFGGVQWASNFGTQPGFIPYPLPNVRGEAVVPSTVDVFIDNAIGARSQVPPGPFEITRLPVVTGQGEVRLVQRDLLGREVVTTVPFYVSPQLLSPGLHEYGYQAGFVRENYGIDSADYGRSFVSGAHRLGFSGRFTGELREELLRDQQTVGAGGTYLVGSLGTVGAALAASHSALGEGRLLLLQAERVTRGLSFGARTQVASKEFTQLGATANSPVPARLTGVSFGYPVERGSLSVSYTEEQRRGAETARIATASYSVSIPGGFFLNFTALRASGDGSNRAFGVTLVKALDARTTLAANATRQGGRDGSLVQVQQNLPPGTGTAFRGLAGTGTSERTEAGVALQTDTGVYSADVGRAAGVDSRRLGVSGGVAWLDGSAFLMRRVNESFAVVDVPGYAGVGVYQDNQLVTRTDAHGRALLTRLHAYQDNPVRIETQDLPLDAEIAADELSAVPYYRSGLLLKFPARPSGGALVVLVDERGADVPEGALVRIEGKPEEFFVARRGEAYLTGLASGDRIDVAWKQGACRAKVEIPPGAGPVPRIGPLICEGAHQ